MVSAVAIIGAGFGDEGKGLMTDFYTRHTNNPIVIRFNGGAQAGHTVVTPESERHVFSHFGSGTLAGAPTYLSEHFIINPLLFFREYASLEKYSPTVFVHPNSIVTTPFEMLINHMLEESRGDEKHGSCGIGIGETVERTTTFATLTVRDLFRQDRNQFLRDFLIFVREHYIKRRVNEDIFDKYKNIIYNDLLIEDYINMCEHFVQHASLSDYDMLHNYNLVFEGAQGLMLDEKYGYFPHVTRSNCGIENVISITNQLEDAYTEHLIIDYVSRVYTTRHGAGPLNHEQPIPNVINDDTNVHGPYQGSLRFAPLDFDLLYSTIAEDQGAQYARLTFTHVDSITDHALFVEDNVVHSLNKTKFLDKLRRTATHFSYGNTHADVELIK